MTLIEAHLDAFCERLAGESRCLLALLRLGYTLAQVDALLGGGATGSGDARTDARGRPRRAPGHRGKQEHGTAHLRRKVR
jgi:hypothetical protein